MHPQAKKLYEILKKELPDLVLMDIMLEGEMDGGELLSKSGNFMEFRLSF
jgi:CheY-like chemotaxis protein